MRRPLRPTPVTPKHAPIAHDSNRSCRRPIHSWPLAASCPHLNPIGATGGWDNAHCCAMSANNDSKVVRISSPLDVATSVPYLLGFAPSASLVFVLFREEDKRLVVTGRVDFPTTPADDPLVLARCQQVLTSAKAEGSSAVHILVYPTIGAEPPRPQSVCRQIADLAGDVGISIWSCGIVAGGRWFDYLASDAIGVPMDTAGTNVAADFVGHGMSYLPDRESLQDCVAGPETRFAYQARECVMNSNRFLEVPAAVTARDRRLIENDIIDYLLAPRCVLSGGFRETEVLRPVPAVLAGWALALADRRVREPVLRRTASVLGTNPSVSLPDFWQDTALTRFCWLVRNTPEEIGAPIAATLAAFCWQLGNGPLALIAADHALTCDPENNLAELIESAVGQGVPPSVWIEMLETMTLAELRSGRRSARSVRSAPRRSA